MARLLPKLPLSRSSTVLPRFPQRAQSEQDVYAQAYTSLLRREAKMGGQLFGPIPAGHRREFFCLDKYTWVWHEEWRDSNGKQRAMTTRYEVRPHGIMKAQGSSGYLLLRGDELRNFYQATRMFRDNVVAQSLRLQREHGTHVV